MKGGFRYAHSGGADWQECVARCASALGKPGGGLGFVYFTDPLLPHAGEILDTLRELTGVGDWVGTVGLGVIATGTEYLNEPALALMVADLPADSYRIFSGKQRAPQPGARTPAGAVAAQFGIVHGDPQTPDMADLIAEMAARVESGYLVGGLSSGQSGTAQVANDILSGGLSGVVLASDVPVATRHTQGCVPLPGRHVVTECEDNILVTLDGRPALDVFREDVGELLGRDLRRAAEIMHVGFPVKGSDTGDYVVRNLLGIDPKNKLIAVGELPEPGGSLLFCKRDAQTAREDLGRILAELRREVPAPRGALYFSCIGRGEHLFGRRGAELGQIRDAIGEVPLVGFFCNGEISHDRLYGYTGVLTLFQ
ncbi:MAG: FIST C-terminal domain-containing protein [Proteobacteria bacterium]|nr:FIST C-terminal domain-containing protein [Pseudomonadota bacterium]